jgi:hypothetical protein
MWRVQKAGASCVNKELSVLQQILKRVRVWAQIVDDYQPLPLPRVGPGIAVNEQQEAAWFAAAAIKPEWRVAYLASLISINTSAGPSEILNLRLENVRLKEIPPEIQIINGTKNAYRIRHIPLKEKAKMGSGRADGPREGTRRNPVAPLLVSFPSPSQQL